MLQIHTWRFIADNGSKESDESTLRMEILIESISISTQVG